MNESEGHCWIEQCENNTGIIKNVCSQAKHLNCWYNKMASIEYMRAGWNDCLHTSWSHDAATAYATLGEADSQLL